MTRTSFLSLVTVFALACGGDSGTGDTGTEGMSEADFKVAFEAAVCAQQEACIGTPCNGSESFITDEDGCTYDAAYADACLNGMACDDAQTLGVSVPIECAQAYACN